MPCNKDPRAPHGFDRTASHTQDRYVCECEGWVAPDDVWTSDVGKLRADLAAAQRELAAYREPTIEDALELIRANAERAPIEQLGTVRNSVLQALKQLGFVRKVQP